VRTSLSIPSTLRHIPRPLRHIPRLLRHIPRPLRHELLISRPLDGPLAACCLLTGPLLTRRDDGSRLACSAGAGQRAT
jgi:hypothetical protein